ncbi:MAG: hypothetical protein KA144_15230 [Xanthomonadaceae bacterium]|nr:hypothetical protein [Xanthomonadaceae bacterium]
MIGSLLLFAFAAATVRAEEVSVSADVPVSSLPILKFEVLPRTDMLAKVAARNCVDDATAEAIVTFESDGTITDNTLTRSSGVRDVDRVILSSLRRAKVAAASAGRAKVPFLLTAEDGGPSSPQDAIRDCDIVSWPSPEASARLRLTIGNGVPPVLVVIVIAWDASGRVVRAAVAEGDGNARVQDAADAWARELQMKPGRAGEGTLSF